jgi:hypothetical protein
MVPSPSRADADAMFTSKGDPVTLAPNRKSHTARRLRSVLLVLGLSTASFVGMGAQTASAATVCTSDGCVYVPVQTPLGMVTVTVGVTKVVTVHLDPITPNTLVVGVQSTIPAGALVAGCPGGCSRTTIDTTGGLVIIDTIQIPPGSLGRFTVPNLAIISLIPPGPPCRVSTVGTTVTFTPIIPPGPPG